jgi:SAM-dependent MidA family methyltransferase|tara:strand:+ start:94 stop:267 length:174 start_codon:yes stop_codon:yes gene_type:complete
MNILELAKEIEGNSERNNILKTLLFPTDMGENFKFMFLSDFIIKDFKSSFKDYRHKL